MGNFSRSIIIGYISRIFQVKGRILKTQIIIVVVYLAAWVANGAFHMSFDLGALVTFYLAVAGKDVAGYTVNSLFNSKRGEAPNAKH